MDVDEEQAEGRTASACKRQKRNDSLDSGDSGGLGESIQVGVEKSASANESAISTTTVASAASNNNNGEGKPMEKENLSEGVVEEKPPGDQAIGPEEQDDQQVPSFLECQLSPESASAVLANNQKIHFPSCTNNAIDSDDDAVEPLEQEQQEEEQAEEQFIPPPRLIRRSRFNIEVLSSLTDSDSNSSFETQRNDSDHGEAAVAEAGDPMDQEQEQEVPALLDASSDDSSSSHTEDFFPPYSSDLSSSEDDDEDEHEHFDANQQLNIENSVTDVMCKCKPAYTWNCAQELMHREHNITNRIDWRGGQTSVESFGRGYYASRQMVEQLTQLSSLSQHAGCVNCLNFNRSGDLICSGSDDLKIIVWDWANDKAVHSFRSGHNMNIFQAKFIDSVGCLDIVTASRDGQVRRAVIPPSGGLTKPERLYSHVDSVHKIVVVPHSRHEVMSAGEDSAVKHFDLRTSTTSSTMLRVVTQDPNERSRRVRLFSIAHHPFAPEFMVSGSDEKLRIYDKRKLTEPVHEMTPREVKDTKITQITCAVYNYSGSEILASYSDDWIYLFDSRNYTDGETLHSYRGHVNSRTIKGVNFFGPRSEYIVSGSDCGHIFVWDKNTESIINFMKGDHAGVVNCLEPHPWMPVLATSGLEHDVKIWAPNGSEDDTSKTDILKRTLKRNFERNINDTENFDINQFQNFIRHFISSPVSRGTRRRAPRSANSSSAAGAEQQERQPRDSSSTSSTPSPFSNATSQRRSSDSSDDTNEVDAAAALDTLPCRTQ